jgi:hypothetical protein
MGKFGPALAVVAALAGCGGGEGKLCEEDLLVRVSVTDPDGAAIPGITVELDELPCADTGDGITFECVAPEPGEYNVYALATSYEPYGQLVVVEPTEDCATPAVVLEDVQLQRESAV